ncbi:MAG: acyl-CoA thioesterase [gamma proteobacterium endosymbiont of Lamellibrachia anaximandri]|nr:acyl-CoA thioesterase [gamma proteobacterium endosymbiont of Lamellibrachia anaximandri]MBL3617702.1 acyl-CoA thioesterase [gamma proteobacterium endosymbiont of Lamellibrachia anaximandri]
MENHKLVLPEHLNHYGYLFGGNLLKWVDEYAWIAASLEHPGCKFVTIGMENPAFKKSIKLGTILRFDVRRTESGNTSVQYQVDVFADNLETGAEASVFSTSVTFVCLNEAEEKTPITPG